MVRHLPRLSLVLVCALGPIACAQVADTSGTKDADQKVQKEFYSAKDRLEAMHAASLFTPKAAGDADLL